MEFALISVALFTLMFGIVQYGFYFFQAAAMEAAVREAARSASLGISDDTSVGGDPCQAWGGSIRDALPKAARNSISSITTTPATARGEDVTITIAWEPVTFRLVPVPTQGEETAVTRVERLGDVTGGCSVEY